MKFPFGPLRPVSSPVAGESDDVCLLGRPVDGFSLGFWIQPHLAKALTPLCARDADTGVTQMLKQHLQVFSLPHTAQGPYLPLPQSLPGWPSPGLRPFPIRPGEGSS